MDRETKFHDSVEQLTPGNRFGAPLARAAALGVRCGYSDDQIMAYIMNNAPGDKRPCVQQVKDAIQYAANLRGQRTMPSATRKERDTYTHFIKSTNGIAWHEQEG